MGYLHGSDLLVGLFTPGQNSAPGTFAPIGYSKSCTITYNAEAKERSHKNSSQSGKWSEKEISKLSVSISTEGFMMTSDTTLTGMTGFSDIRSKMLSGAKLTLRWGERSTDGITDTMAGEFICTNLEANGPADDDASWTASFENSGAVAPISE